MPDDFVFTIFNHGTDYHPDKNYHELITFLHNLMPKAQEARIVKGSNGRYDIDNAKNVTYMINMGPGSETVTTTSRGYEYSTPGQRNPFTGGKKTTEAPSIPGYFAALGGPRSGATEHRSFIDEAKGDTYETARKSGRLFGIGWDDNVARAADMVQGLVFDHGRKPLCINMVGWSRGAVTCLRIANLLFDVFHYEIPLNILAADPVPGGKNLRSPDMVTIPPNVRNYLAIIALDDDRANFQPTDRDEMVCLAPPTTHPVPRGVVIPPPNVHFLPLPGNHSCIVGGFGKIGEVDPGSRAVADLVRHIGFKFLSHHGTIFQRGSYADPIESAEDVVTYYDYLRRFKEVIRKNNSSGRFSIAGGSQQERNVRRRNRFLHTLYPDDFLNDHEHYCWTVERLTNKALPQPQPTYGSSPKKYGDKPPQASLATMGLSYQAAQAHNLHLEGPKAKVPSGTYITLANLNRVKAFLTDKKAGTELLRPENYVLEQAMIPQSEWEKFSAAGVFAKRKRIKPIDGALEVYRQDLDSVTKAFRICNTVAQRRLIRNRMQDANNIVDACNNYVVTGGDRMVAVKCLTWLAVKDVDALQSLL
jgi:hypothetical protein